MSLRRVLIEDPPGESHPAVIDVDDGQPLDDLDQALADSGFRARPIAVNGTIPSPTGSVGSLELEHGSLVTTGRFPLATEQIRSRPLLVVVAGPDSGHVIEIPTHGDVIAGRSEGCDLSLDDPIMSSQHVRFSLDSADRILVEDLDSPGRPNDGGGVTPHTGGGHAALLSLARHRRLWERRPGDDDFLAVAVGLAALPSAIEADDPDDALAGVQWGTPLRHHLLRTGALAIVGSVERGRAVARNLLLNITATHSPREVQIWIITDDASGRNWSSAQWLPHLFVGDDRASIATSEHDRAAMTRRLRAIAEERAAETRPNGTTPLPVHVVIVADGPHGLIGGTSGSGKTELLKTLFVSLCLHNHPDDLSIVVVDFKGGVDHEAIRPLPHVIDVATNLDIDQFKRTIRMLRAESTRRQDLLGSAGASNLVAYRSVREHHPNLQPIPRLLVVVDEFGELLSTPDGKEQLKELESITRIGRALGIHLLLVTQNFENSLPPQIDANAGLQISLRVNKPNHLKIVLDSDVASENADHRIGRAFARFHGRELIEFQTARVAGRRGDLVADDDGVGIQMLPFEVLGGPHLTRRADDVPAEETDMWAMITRIDEAARESGWVESAVRWPSSLPEHVGAVELERESVASSIAIGLADYPEEHRRRSTTETNKS